MRGGHFYLILALALALLVGCSSYYPSQFIQFGVDFTILIHQMPVVPYVFISMFLGIGSLEPHRAGRVLYKLALTLIFVWSVSLVVLFFLAFAFVSIQALFVEQMSMAPALWAEGVGHAVTQAWSPASIPAIIFLVGVSSVGLMHAPEKEKILAPLRVLSEIIECIFEWLLRLIPVSLFFLLAHAVHVMTLDKLHQTGVYLLGAFLFCAFFVLWAFPWALSVFIGLRMRHTLAKIMPCLWLSFLAGDCAVALPLMLKVLKDLLQPVEEGQKDPLVSVMIPIAFAVPMAGSIGNLLFLFFSGLLHQGVFSWWDYVLIGTMGPLTMFSEPVISIPTMLSLLSLPPHLTPLYMLVSVMTDPFFDAAEAFSIIFICYVVTYSMYRRVRFTPSRLFRFFVPTLGLALFLSVGFVGLVRLTWWLT